VASEALELIPFAVIASASPLGLAAALNVLRAGRAQALAVATGVVAGQILACGTLVAIGAAVVQPQREKRPQVEGMLEIVRAWPCSQSDCSSAIALLDPRGKVAAHIRFSSGWGGSGA
jgi:hypothetical protein